MMITLSGIGKADRNRLSKILRSFNEAISVSDAAGILNMTAANASKILSRFAAKGWLSRVKYGLYIPVPLEASQPDVPLEDPWIIVEKLFSPCYIGGWSAAEYHGLTEQIFRTILVMTTKEPRKRELTLKGIKFKTKTVQEKALFGLRGVWRGKTKVNVSDLSRTMIDLLVEPALGGGLRPTIEIFENYLNVQKNDLRQLIEYGDKLNNGAVFKRLGYLLEKYTPNENFLLKECRKRLTAGYAKLDPSLPCIKLVTKWNLWVPAEYDR